MPLKAGSSSAAHSSNVREMMNSYQVGGKIGNAKPRDKKHALAIANAAAYQKGREGKSHERAESPKKERGEGKKET